MKRPNAHATTAYATDGVNVKEGDDFSSFAADACAATHGNSPYVEVRDLSRGHFRGPRGFRLHGLPKNCYWDVAPDGIGTKTVIITAAFSHRQAAQDVMAMTLGDIERWGGLPLIFCNVLDAASLGTNGDSTNTAFREVITGMVETANEQNIVLYRGETAELGACVGSDDPEAVTKFNWAGFALGVYDPRRIITGDSLRPGQKVVALREYGFRSNGISSVRGALRLRFGDQWWNNPLAKEAIRAAAQPSTLYGKLLTAMNGWSNPGFQRTMPMHLVAHLTGGGIKSKFAEDILFPRGLSAELDDLWEPPEIMKQCAVWRGLSDTECYETWNGGQGALVVLDKGDVDEFLECAAAHKIEARVCGTITKTKKVPVVTIQSRFNGRLVRYRAKKSS